MNFRYNRGYFKKLYDSSLDNKLINLRNKAILNEILEHISSGICLEVGFGNGNLLKFLDDNFEVYGVDISKFAVKKIRNEFNPACFKVCDVSSEEIPFSKKFNLITALNVIEHLVNPVFAMKNIYNSLQKGGIFVMYLPTASNLFSRIQYRFLYDSCEHIFRPSVKLLSNLMGKSGFKKREEYAGSFLPFKIKIKNSLLLDSVNLYFSIWQKV